MAFSPQRNDNFTAFLKWCNYLVFARTCFFFPHLTGSLLRQQRFQVFQEFARAHTAKTLSQSPHVHVLENTWVHATESLDFVMALDKKVFRLRQDLSSVWVPATQETSGQTLGQSDVKFLTWWITLWKGSPRLSAADFQALLPSAFTTLRPVMRSNKPEASTCANVSVTGRCPTAVTWGNWLKKNMVKVLCCHPIGSYKACNVKTDYTCMKNSNRLHLRHMRSRHINRSWRASSHLCSQNHDMAHKRFRKSFTFATKSCVNLAEFGLHALNC